jgi:hypothetical protein
VVVNATHCRVVTGASYFFLVALCTPHLPAAGPPCPKTTTCIAENGVLNHKKMFWENFFASAVTEHVPFPLHVTVKRLKHITHTHTHTHHSMHNLSST